MKVIPWRKIGKQELVAKKFDKQFLLQRFEDPYTKNIEEYYQFTATRFASIIFPLTPDKEVMAVKQYRHGAGEILIELPGGNPKTPDQTPEQVAEEELFDETDGYRAEKMIKLNTGSLWSNPAVFTTPFHAFLALGCHQTNEPGKLDKGEYLELLKIPLHIWISMCMNCEITDLKSLAITFLALKDLGLKVT